MSPTNSLSSFSNDIWQNVHLSWHPLDVWIPENFIPGKWDIDISFNGFPKLSYTSKGNASIAGCGRWSKNFVAFVFSAFECVLPLLMFALAWSEKFLYPFFSSSGLSSKMLKWEDQKWEHARMTQWWWETVKEIFAILIIMVIRNEGNIYNQMMK